MLRTLRRLPDARLPAWPRDADHLISRTFGRVRVKRNEQPAAPRVWAPEAEGFREDGHYVIRVALAGVEPKDVDVSITDNALWIKGERKMRDEVRSDDYFVQELAYGKFERVFALPADGEGVKGATRAKWRDGILEVRVPVTQATAATKPGIEMGRGSLRAVVQAA